MGAFPLCYFTSRPEPGDVRAVAGSEVHVAAHEGVAKQVDGEVFDKEPDALTDPELAMVEVLAGVLVPP